MQPRILVHDRHLDWEGCFNVRDLGGLPLARGGETRFGAVVRSDHPRKLTDAGWASLRAHGVTTLVELRTRGAEKDEPHGGTRPRELVTVPVEIEDFGDREFVARMERLAQDGVWSTPLYYRSALAHWRERHAAAVRAVANAGPGTVLVHCGVGRDRTGLVTLLLLAVAGVRPDAIADDFELSYERMRAAGNGAEADEIEGLLAARGTSARALLQQVLASLDVDDYLLGAGVAEAELAAVRARLA